MEPRAVTEAQPTKEVGSDSHDETSQHSQLASLHTKILCDASGTVRSSENLQSSKVPASTSLPPLPRRGQPFPFILPQPLGPLSSPTRSASQADLSTRISKPAPPPLLGTYDQSDFSIWGSRGGSPHRSCGTAMPRLTTAPTAGPTKYISPGNKTEPDLLFPSHHRYPRPSENQSPSQRPENRWYTPPPETNFPCPREEHVSVPETLLAGGITDGDSSRGAQYHKCDECHEAFTTSSWLKQHKTVHFPRFRCGCGAAYIDKSLLLVSSRPS